MTQDAKNSLTALIAVTAYVGGFVLLLWLMRMFDLSIPKPLADGLLLVLAILLAVRGVRYLRKRSNG